MGGWIYFYMDKEELILDKKVFLHGNQKVGMDGKKIQANDLYDFLRPYDIFSTQRKTKSGKNRRGFLTADLWDAVDRHLPKEDEGSAVAEVAPLQEVYA